MCMMSNAMVTLLYFSNIPSGSGLTFPHTTSGASRRIFPFRPGMLGLNTSSTAMTSSLVTGQLGSWLPSMILMSCFMEGWPKIFCTARETGSLGCHFNILKGLHVPQWPLYFHHQPLTSVTAAPPSLRCSPGQMPDRPPMPPPVPVVKT